VCWLMAGWLMSSMSDSMAACGQAAIAFEEGGCHYQHRGRCVYLQATGIGHPETHKRTTSQALAWIYGELTPGSTIDLLD